jgi:hypothetical protein
MKEKHRAADADPALSTTRLVEASLPDGSDTHQADKLMTRGRHAASRELWRCRRKLACGCWDSCRCGFRENPTANRVDSYRAAVEHLERHGLLAAAFTPEIRELSRRGGSDRAVAETIVRRWSASGYNKRDRLGPRCRTNGAGQ